MSLIDSIRERLRRHRRRRDAATQHLADRIAALERLLNEQHVRAMVRDAVGRNPLLAHGLKVYSQNDEDGLIEEILRRCDLTGAGTFVELGVGDGTENNTLNLLLKGWRGVWLGGEPVAIRPDGTRLRFRQCWIHRDNALDLVREEVAALGVAQPDLVSLDLDGNDYHITEALLRGGLRPALWVAEYNARFSAATRWIMPYDTAHRWQGTDYHGASLAALYDLFTAFGYRLVCCNANGVNAFFVNPAHAERFADIEGDCSALYMPANFRAFPYAGHPQDLRVIQAALGAAP